MSATAKLYELVIGERGALSELLEETQGELTPEIAQLLDGLELSINAKLVSAGKYYLGQVAEVAMLDAEIDRLSARKKSRQRGADGLKEYIERMMRAADMEKLKTPEITLAIQNNPPSVQGQLDEHSLVALQTLAPEMVRSVPATFALVKAEVLKAYKAGRPIPNGLEVVQTSSLRIR